jgi:polyisoprenoid-binding protein YceI
MTTTATTATTPTPATTATASPGRTTWAIDPAHTSVEFSVRHLMITTVKGRFTDVKGTVVSDDADAAKGEVDITIGVESIDTREGQRDTHLRSADFFEIEKFPHMHFKSRRITNASGDRFKLIGDLTIRDITREVTLDVTSNGRAKDPWGGERAGFEATTKIKRSDFGLTWNQLLEAGGVAVGDEVKISIDAELVKQA